MNEIKGLDLRKLKEDAVAPSATATAATPRRVSIPVEYTDPDGRVHTATLQAKILDGDERFRQAKMAVDMLQGATWDATPPLYRQRAYMISWLTFALTSPPDWVFTWMQQDINLLTAVYAEVELHEQLYFRGRDEAGDIREEGANIRISSPFSA